MGINWKYFIIVGLCALISFSSGIMLMFFNNHALGFEWFTFLLGLVATSYFSLKIFNLGTENNKNKDEEFMKRLSFLIDVNEMGVDEFSNKLSASPKFINGLISGDRKPGTEILIRLRNNFSVSIDWLLFGDGESPVKTTNNSQGN